MLIARKLCLIGMKLMTFFVIEIDYFISGPCFERYPDFKIFDARICNMYPEHFRTILLLFVKESNKNIHVFFISITFISITRLKNGKAQLF